jgi:hypothetical protein
MSPEPVTRALSRQQSTASDMRRAEGGVQTSYPIAIEGFSPAASTYLIKS